MSDAAAGYLTDVWIDLDGLVDEAQYIRIVRETAGSQTGAFIDALGARLPVVGPSLAEFSSAALVDAVPVPPVPFPVPEPSTGVLIGLSFLCSFGKRR